MGARARHHKAAALRNRGGRRGEGDVGRGDLGREGCLCMAEACVLARARACEGSDVCGSSELIFHFYFTSAAFPFHVTLTPPWRLFE